MAPTAACEKAGLTPRFEGFARQLGGQVERESGSRGTRVHLILPSREAS